MKRRRELNRRRVLRLIGSSLSTQCTSLHNRIVYPAWRYLMPCRLTAELNIGLSVENARGCFGGEVMVGWWYGGCTKSCLCVSFSVVLVMILSLSYVGVHPHHHYHGRPCARAIGLSTEMVDGCMVFSQNCMPRVHQPLLCVLKLLGVLPSHGISLPNPIVWRHCS